MTAREDDCTAISLDFLKDISIAGGLFYVSAFGAGAWSLDTRRSHKTPAPGRI